ncbi:hypothetical protein H3Z08_003795 [Salmonella enterica]|nr:hypothetical protein [Salmonella enterica]EFW6054058.1 hypothetical protein [Salmonella enterica]
MNLTEGQLLFRLQDFHGAEQEALGIGDYEFFQESADIANALRELLQARRTIEELTAVVGQRNGECVRLHSLLDAAEKRIAELEAKLSKPVLLPKDGEPRQHIKEQPAPVVPAEMPKGLAGQIVSLLAHNIGDKFLAQKIWNACRSAMLQGVEQPQNARQNIPENILDGNSPAIPDDWVMVPKEPTQAMINAWLSEVANWRGHVAGYKAALAAAPQHEVK